MSGADHAVEANGAVGDRGAVEAERSDPGVNGWWATVGSSSGVMDALPWAHNLMRMGDDDIDKRNELISDVEAT